MRFAEVSAWRGLARSASAQALPCGVPAERCSRRPPRAGPQRRSSHPSHVGWAGSRGASAATRLGRVRALVYVLAQAAGRVAGRERRRAAASLHLSLGQARVACGALTRLGEAVRRLRVHRGARGAWLSRSRRAACRQPRARCDAWGTCAWRRRCGARAVPPKSAAGQERPYDMTDFLTLSPDAEPLRLPSLCVACEDNVRARPAPPPPPPLPCAAPSRAPPLSPERGDTAAS